MFFFVLVCVNFTDSEKEDLKSQASRNLHRLRQRNIFFCQSLCKFRWPKKKDSKNPRISEIYTDSDQRNIFFVRVCVNFNHSERRVGDARISENYKGPEKGIFSFVWVCVNFNDSQSEIKNPRRLDIYTDSDKEILSVSESV